MITTVRIGLIGIFVALGCFSRSSRRPA